MEQELFKGSSLGRRIAGSVETVQSVKREDLLAYRDAYYVPARTSVAVAGRFDEKEAIALVTAKWGRRPAAKPPKPYLPFSAAKPATRNRGCVSRPRRPNRCRWPSVSPPIRSADPRLPALSV